MNQTVVGVFNSYEAAERAASELAGQGFDRGQMQIKATESDSTSSYGSSDSSTSTSDRSEGTGVMASIRNFFSELFDDDDHAGNYSEAVRRGGAVLTVEADEDRIDIARQVLTGAGAVDIDEQVSSWRSQGWSGYDADATPVPRSQPQTQGSLQGSAQGENVMPVVQEELEVGKRQVSGGAVRVVSRVVSRPVHESVELRSERATIERHPVDRPASEADLAAFEERTIEVQEMAEKAVVNKSARVVEEVVVGKEVSNETQQIDDTVRRTEVEVERVGDAGDRGSRAASGSASSGSSTVGAAAMGSAAAGAATAGSGTGGYGAAGSSGASGITGGSAAGSSGGDASGGRRSFADLEDEFRNDYQTNFANTGATYEEIQPAYRGGYELRGDSRFADSEWNDVEPQIRQRWESEHPGSAWERVKSAVRRGWDRATS